MSVDAASALCCCDVAPPVCCFPDASKPLEVNFTIRSSVFAGTTEVARTLVSGQIATTMLRSGSSSSFVMRSSGGTAALRYETFTRVSKAANWGDSCPGFPNYYVCPPCNEFVECQSFEWVYSGGLVTNSLEIRCIDPCNPLAGTRKAFGIFFAPQENQFIGTVTERFGNNEPEQVAFCGPPSTTQYPLSILGLGVTVVPTIYGREGCLGSSTFQNGYIGGHLTGIPSEWDGICAANPTYSTELNCAQWQTNPNYALPSRMGYSVSSCPILRCNPYNANAVSRGSPVECLLFDCNGQVISYAVSGCDTIFPGSNQGTACETNVRAELALSASVVYG